VNNTLLHQQEQNKNKIDGVQIVISAAKTHFAECKQNHFFTLLFGNRTKQEVNQVGIFAY